MPKVCFVIVFFGKAPAWFGYFARSCASNPEFDWLILKEDTGGIGPDCPSNLRIEPISREELEERVSKVLGDPYHFSYGYKLCDLKPAYGHVFEDLLEGYDYWGYADLDVVWGNLAAFLGEALISGHDVITSREHLIVGHCTLIRNDRILNRIYRDCEGFPAKLHSADYEVFDEKDFHNRLLSLASSGQISIWRKDVQMDDCMIWWQGRPKFLMLWIRGRIFDVFALRELAYFHFIQSKYRKTFHFAGIRPGCACFLIDGQGAFPLLGPAHVVRMVVSATATLIFTLPWYGKILLKTVLPDRIRAFLRASCQGLRPRLSRKAAASPEENDREQ